MLLLVLKILIVVSSIIGLWQLFLLYYSGVGYLRFKQNQYTNIQYNYLKHGRLQIFKRVLRNLIIDIVITFLLISLYFFIRDGLI